MLIPPFPPWTLEHCSYKDHKTVYINCFTKLQFGFGNLLVCDLICLKTVCMYVCKRTQAHTHTHTWLYLWEEHHVPDLFWGSDIKVVFYFKNIHIAVLLIEDELLSQQEIFLQRKNLNIRSMSNT